MELTPRYGQFLGLIGWTRSAVEAVAGWPEGWYDEYRRFRHRVFVMEQGWVGLSAGREGATVPDPADERAHFWLARSVAGALVGAVRVRQ